jgi:hypothetical protein
MNATDSSAEEFAINPAGKKKEAYGIGSEYVTTEGGEVRRVQIPKDVKETPKKLLHWYQCGAVAYKID